ncbi:MAG: hypothetical protein JW839_00790 [Candidatus Lokiarchaeota archaeon]|nr:hypothetical protein [Candidatus Lokiarchaeota archaeon]
MSNEENDEDVEEGWSSKEQKERIMRIRAEILELIKSHGSEGVDILFIEDTFFEETQNMLHIDFIIRSLVREGLVTVQTIHNIDRIYAIF